MKSPVTGSGQTMRLNQEALTEKVQRMMEDPLILIRPESESVRLHRTHARLVKQVRHELLKQKQKRGIDIHRVIREEKEVRSIANTLTKTDRKYPGILRLLTRNENCTETGERFGISRQRVHQLKAKMLRYAVLEEIPFAEVWTHFSYDSDE